MRGPGCHPARPMRSHVQPRLLSLVRRRRDGALLPSGCCQVRTGRFSRLALRGLWLMCHPTTFLPHCLWTGLREMALPHVPGKEHPSIGQLVGPRGECPALGRTSCRLTGQGLGAARACASGGSRCVSFRPQAGTKLVPVRGSISLKDEQNSWLGRRNFQSYFTANS